MENNFSENGLINNDNLAKKNNLLSIIGFALGIVAFFFNFFGLIGVAAVVCSGIGLSQIKKTQEKGKIFAILGIIFGVINVVYFLIVLSLLMTIF